MDPNISELRMRRLLLGLTQEEIAQRAGCTQRAVSYVESGSVRGGRVAQAVFAALERIEREDRAER